MNCTGEKVIIAVTKTCATEALRKLEGRFIFIDGAEWLYTDAVLELCPFWATMLKQREKCNDGETRLVRLCREKIEIIDNENITKKRQETMRTRR